MKANIVGIKRYDFINKAGEQVKSAKLQLVSGFPLDDSISTGLQISECSIDFNLSKDIKVPCTAYLDFDGNGRLLDLDIDEDNTAVTAFDVR